MNNRRIATAFIAAVVASSAAAPAQAQLFSNFGSLEHNLDNLVGQALDMMPPGIHGIRVGLGPVMQPNFFGDSSKSTRVAPVISLRYRNFIEVDNNAIRVNFLGNWGRMGSNTSAWSTGPTINIDWGRATSDSPKLVGVGGISTSFEMGAYVAYRVSNARYRVRARHDVAGATGGWLVDGQIDYRVVDARRLFVNIGAQVTWADSKWMGTWFGITPGQSAASGLPIYRASSGLRDASVRLSAEYLLNDRWSVLGTVGYARMLSGAANNPLVKMRGSRNQPTAGAFVIYAF